MTLFKVGFLTITVLDIVDILLVTWLFIKLYAYFRGTRAGQMLVGIIIILLSSFVFRAIGMSGMTWIVDQVQTVWVVAFVILFQPELRRLMIYVGTTRFLERLFRVGSSSTIDAVVNSSIQLQQKGWGALIVLQRDAGLKNIKEAGTSIKAEASSPLLVSIFNPQSPLHDGAVIIQNNIIEAAQCILPLTESDMIDPELLPTTSILKENVERGNGMGFRILATSLDEKHSFSNCIFCGIFFGSASWAGGNNYYFSEAGLITRRNRVAKCRSTAPSTARVILLRVFPLTMTAAQLGAVS